MKRSKGMGIVCCCILVAGSAAWLGAMEIEDAPESVQLDHLQRLYEPVEFDHLMHAEVFACSICHHHTTGGGTQEPACLKCHAGSGAADEVACSACHPAKGMAIGLPARSPVNGRYHIDQPGLLGAFHLQCLGCHRVESGPIGCQDCHSLSPAGIKRFNPK